MRKLHLIRQHWGPFWRHKRTAPGWRIFAALGVALFVVQTALTADALNDVSAMVEDLAILLLTLNELFWADVDDYLKDRNRTHDRNDIWED
jgi:hypothetical protein